MTLSSACYPRCCADFEVSFIGTRCGKSIASNCKTYLFDVCKIYCFHIILPAVIVSFNSQIMLFGFNAKRHLFWVHWFVIFPSQVILLDFNQNISSLSVMYLRVWNWKQLWVKQVRNTDEKKKFLQSSNS